jgi:hypothetical protein
VIVCVSVGPRLLTAALAPPPPRTRAFQFDFALLPSCARRRVFELVQVSVFSTAAARNVAGVRSGCAGGGVRVLAVVAGVRRRDTSQRAVARRTRTRVQRLVSRVSHALFGCRVDCARAPRRGVQQTDVSAEMWAVLVDWLVDVCEEFALRCETLHVAVAYLRV